LQGKVKKTLIMGYASIAEEQDKACPDADRDQTCKSRHPEIIAGPIPQVSARDSFERGTVRHIVQILASVYIALRVAAS
jgi:hypothetical protein